MEKLVKIDDETPIEDYPNYLGHIWESEYEFMDLINEISFVKDILWRRYEELVSYLDDPIRHLNVNFGESPDKKLIAFDASENALANALDCVPSIEVRFDDFGDAHIFFLKNINRLLLYPLVLLFVANSINSRIYLNTFMCRRPFKI